MHIYLDGTGTYFTFITELIQVFDEQLTGMGFSPDEILELLKKHYGK